MRETGKLFPWETGKQGNSPSAENRETGKQGNSNFKNERETGKQGNTDFSKILVGIL